MMTDIERIQDLRNQLTIAEESFLQQRGWRTTSSTPDCVWVWEKTWKAKTIWASRDHALSMEEHGMWE